MNSTDELDATVHTEESSASPKKNSPQMSKLAEDVEEFVDLTMQIAEANKGLKVVKARKKELGDKILEFMRINGLDIINSKSGGQIARAKGTKLGKVDRTYLEDTLANKVGRDQALDLMSYAFDNRTSEETSSVRLAKKSKS